MENLKTNLNDPDAFDLAKWEKELQTRNLPGMKRVMPKGQKQSSMKDELVARAMSDLEKQAAAKKPGKKIDADRLLEIGKEFHARPTKTKDSSGNPGIAFYVPTRSAQDSLSDRLQQEGVNPKRFRWDGDYLFVADEK